MFLRWAAASPPVHPYANEIKIAIIYSYGLYRLSAGVTTVLRRRRISFRGWASAEIRELADRSVNGYLLPSSRLRRKPGRAVEALALKSVSTCNNIRNDKSSPGSYFSFLCLIVSPLLKFIKNSKIMKHVSFPPNFIRWNLVGDGVKLNATTENEKKKRQHKM